MTPENRFLARVASSTPPNRFLQRAQQPAPAPPEEPGNPFLDAIKGTAQTVGARFVQGASDVGAAFENTAARIDERLGQDPTRSRRRAANFRASGQLLEDLVPKTEGGIGRFAEEAVQDAAPMIVGEGLLSGLAALTVPKRFRTVLQTARAAKGASTAERAAVAATNAAKRAGRGAAEGAAFGVASGEDAGEEAETFALLNPAFGAVGDVVGAGVRAARGPAKGMARRVAEVADPEAFVDPLTGLRNQTTFRRAQPKIDSNQNLEVLTFDAVGLKAHNDALGEAAGNTFLARIGQAIKATAEKAGVDARDMFRAGGDEFAVVVPKGQADKLGRAIKEAIGETPIGETGKVAAVRYGVGDTYSDAAAAAQAAKKLESGAYSRFGDAAPVEAPKANPEGGFMVGPGAAPEAVSVERAANMAKAPAVNPDEFVNVPKFALDEAGETQLRSTVEQTVKEHGLAPKKVVSWNETRALANDLGLSPLDLSKEARMGGPEMLAIRNAVKTNIEETARLSQQLAQGDGSVAGRLDELDSQTDELLARFIKDRSQTGRDLNNLKILANATMEPVVWLTRAQRLSGAPLPDLVKADINRLIQAGDKTALAKYVSGLRRASAGEKLSTVWKAGLLTAPPTHAVNITSTGMLGAMETAKDLAARGFDLPLSALTGVQTKAFNVGDQVRAAGRGAKRGVKDAKSALRGDPSAVERWDTRQVNYKSPVLNAYTKGVFRTLKAEDSFFKAVALERSLGEQARVIARREGLKGSAQNARVAQLAAEPTEEMGLKAIVAAEYATFQRTTPLGRAGSGLREAFGTPGQFVLPFTSTPGAVAHTVVDYSPLGFIQSVPDMMRLFKAVVQKNKNAIPAAQQALVEKLGRASVGTAPIVAGYILYKNGVLSLSYPESAGERGRWQVTGQQENAVKVGDRWISLERVSPVGNLMALGGHIAKAMGDESLSPVGKVLGPTASIAKTVSEQSFMESTRRVLEALDAPERTGESFVQGFAASWVPAIVNRVARLKDPVMRERDTVKEAVMGRIPGMAGELPAKIDPLGQELSYPGGFTSSIVDPFYASVARDIGNPVRSEIDRLKVSITARSKNQAEDAKQYEDRMRREGSVLAKGLEALVGSNAYRNVDTLAQQEFQADPQGAADAIKKAMVEELIARTRTEFTRYWQQQGRLPRAPRLADLLEASR